MKKQARNIGLAIVGAGRVGLIRGELAARHPAVGWIGIAEINPDRAKLVANHVYVIPRNRSMVIKDGKLNLLPRGKVAGQHRPVDQFLRSLADDQHHRAIGVILSGTGSDGVLGLEAIKGEGGITFAKDATAQRDGMPRGAVASGFVAMVPPRARIWMRGLLMRPIALWCSGRISVVHLAFAVHHHPTAASKQSHSQMDDPGLTAPLPSPAL